MKRVTSICATCLVMVALATQLYADQKVKKRMSVSGQSFDTTSFIKGQRTRDEMNFGGGQFQMITIHQCDLGQDIVLNDRTKTYMINKTGATGAKTSTAGAKAGAKAAQAEEMEFDPPVPQGGKKGGTVTISTSIQDTGERKDFFGYEAKHLKTTMHMQSSADACDPNKSTTMSTDGWYINFKEKVQFCERPMAGGGGDGGNPMRRSEGGCVDKIKMTGAGVTSMFGQGYPVDVTMSFTDDKGKSSSMRTQALEISSATLDASLFDAPAGYKQTSSYAEMMGMNMGSMMGAIGRGAMGNAGGARGGPMTPEVKGGTGVSRRMAGTREIGPKAPGKLRVGVVAFNDKTGKVTDGDKLRKSLMDGIEHFGYEAVPIDSQSQEAAMKDCKDLDCDYIVFNDMSAKASNAQTAKKFGKLMGGLAMGPLGAAAMGAATNGPQFFEGSIDFQLYKLATPDTASLTGTNEAKGKDGGNDAMGKESKDVAKQIAKGK